MGVGEMAPNLYPAGHKTTPDPPEKRKEDLSDISYHMGRGLQCKECCNYILHLELKFSDNLQYGLQKLDEAAKLLGIAENELRGKFFLPPIPFKI